MKNAINILFKKISCVIFVTLVVLPGFAVDCDVGNTANAVLTPSGNITAPDNWSQYLRDNNIVVYTNANSVKPATGKLDDYIKGQEWSVQFETGIVSGYAACGGNSYKTTTTYSYPWSSAFGGCLCSLDKESWYFTKKVSTTTGWENQITQCYEVCPYTCAQYVATNSTFRTRLFGSVTECPVSGSITQYTITYDMDGGTGCSNTTYTDSAIICTPTRDGYTFDGWMDNNTYEMYNGGETVSNINLDLVAFWTVNNYTITYNLNGGTGCENTTYAASTTLCTPTRDGYTFAGWATSVNGSVVYQGGDTISGTNLILYAKWDEAGTCADCYCPETGTPLTTSEISGLPTWNDMISQGIITGSGTSYKPAPERLDDYIKGQEWSVQFNNGVVNGYSACFATSCSLSQSPYYSITSANSGCVCSLDKSAWWFITDLSNNLSDRAAKTEYCRANCAKTCATWFANNQSDIRTKMTSTFGSCPVEGTIVQGCPENHYTIDTVCTACPSGTYSPAGATKLAQCGHILHIGDNSNDKIYLSGDKTTVPALHVNFDGQTWYANMVENQTKISSDSDRYMQIEYNNKKYYVCDDTTCLQQ